ncbi:MAG: hypothetical protein ACREV4_04335 [Gammaproteobacteria bacterium]
MKEYTSLVSVLMFAATLSGCGEQRSTSTEPSDAGSTSSAATTDTAVNSAPVTGSGSIDHARDIKEFELKRSLSGVESLIEDFKAKGADISDLEAQKKDLEQELGAFKSG